MAETGGDGAPARLTDAEIHRCVAETVLEVLLPALRDDAEWARAAAVQLVGLTRYAAVRSADPAIARTAELVAVLEGLASNPLVAELWNGDRAEAAVLETVSVLLVAAVGRHDGAADEIRSQLRAVVIRHLDDELAETSPLVDAFRGRLRD